MQQEPLAWLRDKNIDGYHEDSSAGFDSIHLSRALVQGQYITCM